LNEKKTLFFRFEATYHQLLLLTAFNLFFINPKV